MSMLAYLFPMRDLQKMDKTQLAMLHDAVQHHMHNSPEIRAILKSKVQPVLNKLKEPEASKPAKKAGSSKA
jgi:hypothetical protein